MDGIHFEYTTKSKDEGAEGRIIYDFKAQKVEGEDDGGMFRFEGMASTFGNVDLDGDIIEQGAFTISTPAGDITINADEIAILGDVSFP